MNLASIYHSGPVTALCCHQGYILAGIGSFLHCYKIKNNRQTNLIEVLPGRNIHGFMPESDNESVRVCVYGQKCIRLVKFNSLDSTIQHCSDLIEFKDWIWDIAWIQSKNDLCLALGHNEVLFYSIEQNLVTTSVKSQEKCILYCAKFLTTLPDCVVLAAGTVFNHVVLWSPSGTQHLPGLVPNLHTLTGHQGVIFSVDYDARSQIICSASDDRSIRLHQLVFPSNTTGSELSDWCSVSSHLLHAVYGHSARVWDVKLLQHVFVSVAEDSTCCVWSYDGHVMQKFKGHKGKSIWSLAVDRGGNFVVTGGGDHSIRLWKLQQVKQQASTEEALEDKNQGQQLSSSVDLKISAEDFPRNITLLSLDKVLITTDVGNVLLYDMKGQHVDCVYSDPAFSSYTVLAISPSRLNVALGNMHGTVRILQVKEGKKLPFHMQDNTICKGKVLSVVWINEYMLLTTAFEGIITLWHVSADCTMEILNVLELPISKYRWVSMATICPRGSHLVVGDRCGSMYLYRLDTETKGGHLTTCLPKLHGKGGVTDLRFHGSHVYSAGRDGRYRQYLLDRETNTLTLLNTNRVCRGFEWIERITFTEDEDIQIQGFHTNLFVVWSVGRNQKLLEINCGGGHRAWDFCLQGDQAMFVCVKARQIIATAIIMEMQQVILKSWLHGRELCDAKFIFPAIKDKVSDDTKYLMVSCSEDTSVCISMLHCTNHIPTLSILHTLTGHISSVRCLATVASSQPTHNAKENKKLLFTAGGRAQIRVWRIKVQANKSLTNSSPQWSRSVGDFLDEDKQEPIDLQQNTCQNLPIVISHAEKETCPKWKEFVSKQTNCPQNRENLNCPERRNNCSCTTNCQEGETFCSTNYPENSTSKFPVYTDTSNCSSNCDGVSSATENVLCSYECLTGVLLNEVGRRFKKPWKFPHQVHDPETRVLDIAVERANRLGDDIPKDLFVISTACSDGFLRMFTYEERTDSLNLLIASEFHMHCVLKTCMLVVHSGDHVTGVQSDHVIPKNRTRLIVLSAATDGVVAFWDLTAICRNYANQTDCETPVNGCVMEEDAVEFQPFFTLSLHQNGINGLSIHPMSETEYILATGGDDNALHVVSITMVTDDLQQMITIENKRGSQMNAHATQITGVWLISQHHVITVSIDQRLIVWSMRETETEIQLVPVAVKFVGVSDVSNLHIAADSDGLMVLLSGLGVEVLRLQTECPGSTLLAEPLGKTKQTDLITAKTRLVL